MHFINGGLSWPIVFCCGSTETHVWQQCAGLKLGEFCRNENSISLNTNSTYQYKTEDDAVIIACGNCSRPKK
jgi:hypothetical protein